MKYDDTLKKILKETCVSIIKYVIQSIEIFCEVN